jgi:hypothetical protein
MQEKGLDVLFPEEYKKVEQARQRLVNREAIGPVLRTHDIDSYTDARIALSETHPELEADPHIRTALDAHGELLRRGLTRHDREETRQFQESTGQALSDLGSATRMEDVDAIAKKIPARFQNHPDVQTRLNAARDRIAQTSGDETIASLQEAGATDAASARKILDQWAKKGKWKREDREYRYILHYFTGTHEPKPDVLGQLPRGTGTGGASVTANADAVLAQ